MVTLYTTATTFLLFSLHHRHISIVFPPPPPPTPPPHFYCFLSTTTATFLLFFQVIKLAGRPGEWTKRETRQRITHCSYAHCFPGSCDQAVTVSCIVKQFARKSFGICRLRGSWMREFVGVDQGEGREVTLSFSPYVSWPTPPASMTSHSNGQEPRVACAN